jgi:bifunctional non-homologous end joining protein LigD
MASPCSIGCTSKGYDEAAHLFAFDLLEIDGADIRREPLCERKRRLRKLIGRSKSRIFYNEHIKDDGEMRQGREEE